MSNEIKTENLFSDSLLYTRCVPDYARVAWAIANQNGITDAAMEETSMKKKRILHEPHITYRDWFHILWAGHHLIGRDWPYLIAQPLTLAQLGPAGTACQYSPHLKEAFDLIENWSDAQEPINLHVRARRQRDGDWVISGEYPLSGWIRSIFTISAAKLATCVLRECLMTDELFEVTLNCERVEASASLINSVFPGGINYDHAQQGAWRIRVPHEVMVRPLPLADATRLESAHKYMKADLKRVHQIEVTFENLVESIQYTTMNILSASQIADRLDVSRKVYESKLRALNTSHKEIADRMSYLRYLEMQPYLSKSEITRKLGFVDSRAIDRLIKKFVNPDATEED